MESLDEPKNFLKHVFNLNDDSKSEMLNIVQYSIISIIPIVFLNKTMSKYIPESDENKGNVEITAEVLVQVIMMFLGLLIVHRINTYIPTYSGVKYPETNMIFTISAVLMITLSLQTKLGEKVSILTTRVYDLWEGNKTIQNGVGNSNLKVSQPLSNDPRRMSSQQSNPIQQIHQPNQTSYNDGTSINSLPNSVSVNATAQLPQMEQHIPNYNNMNSTAINMTNASQNGVNANVDMYNINMSEPIAASDALGGSFSNW